MILDPVRRCLYRRYISDYPLIMGNSSYVNMQVVATFCMFLAGGSPPDLALCRVILAASFDSVLRDRVVR